MDWGSVGVDCVNDFLRSGDGRRLMRLLGRRPTAVETAVVQVMWSEHCSYRRSKYFLRQLSLLSSAPLLVGMGENAGVVQLTSDLAVAFKVESHNHPSALMPYQGAATGVGGILRDILAMGAWPVALLNSLHFDLYSEEGKRLFGEVVRGIGDYGNCVGVPTIGGEIVSHPCYRWNPLVNVACLGKVSPDRIYRSSTARSGDVLLYFGNRTGRDGLEGALFASLPLEAGGGKSAVQVADPFMGRLVMLAAIELAERGIPSAMQDMGAAGLTCAGGELAYKSGLGLRLYLDNLPLRVGDLRPEELLLSESQERMLVAVPAERRGEAEEVLRKYPLDYAWVGELGVDGGMEVFFQGKRVVSLPLEVLLEGCPLLEYPHIQVERAISPVGRPLAFPSCEELLGECEHIFLSKEPIYRQFDYEVQLRTVGKPGSGKSLLYDQESGCLISFTMESRAGWVSVHSYWGTLAVLALAYRSSIANGAMPLGLSDCLNFPSPERERTMVDFAGVVSALREASVQWELPVSGGNVSFYNESVEGRILPTPVFVFVGKSVLTLDYLSDLRQPGYLYTTSERSFLHSEVLFFYSLRKGGYSITPPVVDLQKERRLARIILELSSRYGEVFWVQAINKGGLLKRILEHFASFDLDIHCFAEGQSEVDFLFGEGEGSYLFYIPEGKVGLEKVLRAKLRDFSFRRVAHIRRGKGWLYFNGKSFLDLKPWLERSKVANFFDSFF
ncbi:MAG: phosphoribosylformylglycinamidine synthase subunit PurL [Planctomycetota bacterium]|nr:MAG: phosphoribosylformylglycinamidine synthase subunit PurL [Planctomycetota bacterium]